MPTYRTPGVHVAEVPAGARPIEGVGTSVAAFVGLAARGPFNEPTRVSSWTHFAETFGDFVENSYLAHAVYGWFLNGGGNCFVVRIGANGSSDERPTPDKLRGDDYAGNAAHRAGFTGLEGVTEVTMVVVPDLAAALEHEAIDLETFKAVQLDLIAHCELMGDRLAILDTPPALNPHQVHQWRVKDAGYDSAFATMYWPWLKVVDPATATNKFVPPAGHVAGVWARSDDSRGVHKAPANEVVRGAIELQTQITRNEHDLLNPVGINVVRLFPGRGPRVWGARTLSTDAQWRYLNVRRLVNYLEESILLGTQWVVFEPNDRALWARIRGSISAFLITEWRKGALVGATPDEAFFVSCDETTNPAESIDAGQVTCQIGVALLKPAEFVIFQLSHFSGGASLASE